MADDNLPIRHQSTKSTQSRVSTASRVTNEVSKMHHERLRKLRALDGSTKIPFILVELRGISNGNGFIEICGKDEYGVYTALEEWLTSTMRCTKLDAGDLSDNTPLPFCDGLFKWEGFLTVGADGTNNIGLATMQLVEFMCNELSWTLGVINGGNVGSKGEIREQQVIFKAPHPMNIEAGHIMIELRSAGYIEVCGSDRKAKDIIHKYFVREFGAKAITGHQDISDRYFKCADGAFKERGRSGENNLGQLTVKVCDALVKILPGWSLVTMNGGNYGDAGCHREQQLVFRCDNNPLADSPHIMVEMREAGYIEVCGGDTKGIYDLLSRWLADTWGCKDSVALPGQEPFCDKKFKWQPKDMMVASAQITEFFHRSGWQMFVCSQGTVAAQGNAQSREQQILFRPDDSGLGIIEPHLFIELYTGEGDDKLYQQDTVLQVLANQFVRIREVGDCSKALAKLNEFMTTYVGGIQEPDSPEWKSFGIDVFLGRGICDNNLGCWTMRLCDFMVDRLGWSFVVCNVCNLGPQGQYREQQLIFRYDGERREIPPVKEYKARIDEILYVGLKFPPYWETPEVLSLKQTVGTVTCTPPELEAFQEMFDTTFKRVITRDRVYEYQLKVSEEMPFRLEVVHAFRSEHAELYRQYMERRSSYRGGTHVRPKTLDAGAVLNQRLLDGEALLCHGTNPSSAMAILKTGFALEAAGKSTGTMFGYGIYLAESASKSDEYARDDNGGTYPGLMAMLMCRSLVGDGLVVDEAGDYIQQAKQQGKDCVVGDRETKVGTYREFIFWDERQIYPEYAVIYKRVYDQSKVPQRLSHLLGPAKGTSGRNWMVKMEKGWVNMGPDVSFQLTKCETEGKASLQVTINDVSYSFDLTAMTQTNTKTGTSRSIRPPERK